MDYQLTDIEGLFIIEPKVFGDSRGYFFESFSQRELSKVVGKEITFVQDNESKSCYGVLRGLHFQKAPYAQSKLTRCVKGKVLDVVVDLRRNSSTFGKIVTIELSEENKQQLFIPKGCAHGFAVLSEEAIFQYKCDEYYHPEAEGGVLWSDTTLAINWQIPLNDIILSEKDRKHPEFKDSYIFE